MTDEAKTQTAEIVHAPNPYDEPRSLTPMDLLQMAVDKNADIDKLEKLLEMKRRWDADEAKKAFIKALNAFKADPPEIVKDRHVAYKEVRYNYATLANVCDQVTGALSKHGISHRWRTEQPSEGLIRVTCILTHDMGHSEETTLAAGPDSTGSKNAIQALGSAVKYLQRYTLLAATGLEAGDADNDGRSTAKWEELQQYLDAIALCHNLEILQTTFGEGFKKAMAAEDAQAANKLVAAKDTRKQEILKTEAA
jgi:ERF superfamily